VDTKEKMTTTKGNSKKTLEMNALGENKRHLVIPPVLITQRHNTMVSFDQEVANLTIGSK
jgi:hypothetical protein